MPSVIIVGAGLSGLTAARELVRQGWGVKIVEARDRIGGRIQTDYVDGFLLDHGFQVYLTGYAIAGRELDLPALNLGVFPAGALIQQEGKRYRVCDPTRSPWYLALSHALQTALAPVGSLRDKLLMSSFRNRVVQLRSDEHVIGQQVTAKQRLVQMGFSKTIIDRFFRPFFSGIFLEDQLSTAADRMEFVFKTFSQGFAALPQNGMQSIPLQIAQSIPASDILLNATVKELRPDGVVLSDGTTMQADHVLIATEEPAAARLLAGAFKPSSGAKSSTLPQRTPGATSCLYFAVDSPPLREATLVLNGDANGIINNLCFPNFAQPSYAPSGLSLLSVSTLKHIEMPGEVLLDAVRGELVDWFGVEAMEWRHLRTYRIPYALPSQTPIANASRETKPEIARNLWRCGDYCQTASIEGAIQSGLAAAKAMIEI
jgi:phytoene dehydrogenase-like protein